ncbi:hypothetical protein MKX01_008461 [Papaver californicum]|nr:hypothetical protein MKX01_008461 [Papaver californicum]
MEEHGKEKHIPTTHNTDDQGTPPHSSKLDREIPLEHGHAGTTTSGPHMDISLEHGFAGATTYGTQSIGQDEAQPVTSPFSPVVEGFEMVSKDEEENIEKESSRKEETVVVGGAGAGQYEPLVSGNADAINNNANLDKGKSHIDEAAPEREEQISNCF